MTCRQKAAYGLLEQLTTNGGSTPLLFGNLVHRVLELTYADKNPGYAMEHLETAANELAPVDNAEYEDYEICLGWAEALIPSYFLFWGKKDFESMRWEHLEGEFGVPYDMGLGRMTIPLRGKIDGAYRIGTNNSLWLFETKTKGQIKEDFLLEQLSFDFQINYYCNVLTKISGVRPKGVNYNILRRPNLRRSSSETLKNFVERCQADIIKRPEFYFQRYEVAVTEKDMDKWNREFKVIMQLFEQWVSNPEYYTYKNPNACSIYGVCPYMRICANGDRSGYVGKESHFPELEYE
jgi:hypothetical protein